MDGGGGDDMAGRYSKPTSLKVIEGNRGKRKLNKQEPDPEYLEDLSPPEWLPEPAKAVWNDIVPHLRLARMLSTVDVPMLSKGCVAIAQYRHATRMLGEQLVIEGGQATEGEPPKAAQLNQWMVAQSMAFKQAMAVFMQFGMSPAARTRIAIQPQGDLFGGTQDKAGQGYFS